MACLFLVDEFVGVLRWRHAVFGFELPGKIMDGRIAQHVGNFRDGVLAFFDEQTAFFQLHVADELFGRHPQVVFEQRLQTGAGNGKMVAQFFHIEAVVNVLVDIDENFVEQFAFEFLLHGRGNDSGRLVLVVAQQMGDDQIDGIEHQIFIVGAFV